MRHGKKRHQLNRFTSWHKATLKSLAQNVLTRQRIHTTKARAKAVMPLLEKLITLGKENTLAARRRAFQILGSHDLVKHLFTDIAPRFSNRSGGYLRILLMGNRRGDNASLAILELTEIKEKKRAKPAKEKAAEKEEPILEKEVKKEPVKEEHTHKDEGESKKGKKFLGGLRGIFKKERDSL